jgi:hypothetical protein
METFNYEFKGYFAFPSECKIRVVIDDDKQNGVKVYHFCFEDIGVGTSVTNASEMLATEMVLKYGVHPRFCHFYETYLHDDRTFDEITYTWINGKAENANWKPSTDRQIFDLE